MNVEYSESPPLKPTRTLEQLFTELVNVGYALGVQWQDVLDPDDDLTQLRLSDWLDETAALCSVLELRREAQI
jgi:hypothetical protein